MWKSLTFTAQWGVAKENSWGVLTFDFKTNAVKIGFCETQNEVGVGVAQVKTSSLKPATNDRTFSPDYTYLSTVYHMEKISIPRTKTTIMPW